MAERFDNPGPRDDAFAHPPREGSDRAAGFAESDASGGGYDLVLERRGRRLVFRVRPGQERAVLAGLADMADDPADPLTWRDAAVLSDRLGRVLRHRLDALTPDTPTPPRPKRAS